MSPEPTLVVTPSPDAVTNRTLALLHDSVAATEGVFALFLAGGSTPQGLHRALARDPDWPWERTIVLFGDERCVPPKHADSNYAAAKASLLDHVDPLGVLRMPGERVPEEAAEAYETLLNGLPPVRKLVAILGMGADGHTASLFPGHASPSDRRVTAVAEPRPGLHRRLTVTHRLLAECDEVLLMVTGGAKADRLAEAWSGDTLPISRVFVDRQDKPTWVVADKAAAGALKESSEQ